MAPGFEQAMIPAKLIPGDGIGPEIVKSVVEVLLAAGLMLEHVDQPQRVNRLRAAIDQVLRKDAVRTPDLGGTASTAYFTQSIIRRLGA